MMKISGIVIGLLSASIVAVTPPTPSTGITLEMYDIGPYELLQSDPTENYIINNYYSSAIIINELFRFGDEDNPNQQTFKTALHRVEKGGRYTGEVTLPTSIFLGNDGMKVTIEVYFTRTSEKIYSREFTIYPIEGKTIDPTTMDSYSVTGKRINITIRKVNPFTETMTFSRFYDYFLTSVYYRLPIEQFSYTTNVDIDEFNVGSAFLVISGLKDYFPGLTYFNDEARIPLVNIYSEGTKNVYKELRYEAYDKIYHPDICTRDSWGRQCLGYL